MPFVAKSQTMFELYGRPAKIISSNYTMAQFDVTLIVNTNAGNDTLTLPAGTSSYSGGEGLVYHIKNIGTNYVVLRISPSSGDSIENSISPVLINPQMSSKEVQPATIHSWFIH